MGMHPGRDAGPSQDTTYMFTHLFFHTLINIAIPPTGMFWWKCEETEEPGGNLHSALMILTQTLIHIRRESA